MVCILDSDSALNLAYNKTLVDWSRDMVNFNFLEKSLATFFWDIGQYVYCNGLLTRLWRAFK